MHFYILVEAIKNTRFLEGFYAIFIFIYMTQQDLGWNWQHKGGYLKFISYTALVIAIFVYILYLIMRSIYKKYRKSTCICIVVSLLLFPLVAHFIIIYSKRNWGRGFYNQWIETPVGNMTAECKLKDYYWPNYDLGSKFLYPLHWLFEPDCNTKF